RRAFVLDLEDVNDLVAFFDLAEFVLQVINNQLRRAFGLGLVSLFGLVLRKRRCRQRQCKQQRNEQGDLFQFHANSFAKWLVKQVTRMTRCHARREAISRPSCLMRKAASNAAKYLKVS